MIQQPYNLCNIDHYCQCYCGVWEENGRHLTWMIMLFSCDFSRIPLWYATEIIMKSQNKYFHPPKSFQDYFYNILGLYNKRIHWCTNVMTILVQDLKQALNRSCKRVWQNMNHMEVQKQKSNVRCSQSLESCLM